LKLKEGTHRTPVSMRLSEILTLPMCVTEVIAPFRSLTRGHNSSDGSEKEVEQIIWSVAPVSTIHGAFCDG
jgi:hypothetical protein